MIKVHLILGFLGAGKTTFLKKILKNPALDHEQLLLVVNDYGLENYDAHQLQKEGIEIIEITNGCLCCSYKNQFEEILMQCANRQGIDRIFIEPSGLFIPGQVLDAFNREPIKSTMKLEPIVSIVDYQLLSGKKLWPPAIERLIEAGQILVRNKVDKVSDKDRNLLDARIKTLNDHELMDFDKVVQGYINMEIQGSNLSFYNKSEVEHGIKFVQLSTDLEFRNREKLYSFLSEQNPPLIRAKGNVLLDGQLTFINYVNNELELDSAAANGEVSLSCFYE